MKTVVTRACGHEEQVAIYGPYKDRERRLEYEKTKVCYACYKAQQAAEADAAKAEVRDVIQRLGLPELQGSEKQVAWALSIREKRVAKMIESCREIGKTVDELVAQWGKCERGQYVFRAFAETSAAKWIETRELSYKDWTRLYHPDHGMNVPSDPIASVMEGIA